MAWLMKKSSTNVSETCKQGNDFCSTKSPEPSSISRSLSEEEGEGTLVTDKENFKNPLVYGILSSETYEKEYNMGDVPREYWSKISSNVFDFNGRWQIVLNRSEAIDSIMKALGLGVLSRKVMAHYVSEAEFVVMEADALMPTIKYVSYLPMGRVKQAVMKFDGSPVNLLDGDVGMWTTTPCWVNGRALQRRESSKGVMFDVRVVFENDPIGKIEGPVMLFLWSFMAKGTSTLLSANRWFKKLR